MSTKNDIQKAAMLEALEKSLGIVTSACKSVGISRNTHYTWLKQDDIYKEAVEDIENIALDFAESQLHKQIKRGNTAGTIFYLKTKGKKRGYIERMETENTNKNLDLSNLTDEELEERLKQAKRVTNG